MDWISVKDILPGLNEHGESDLVVVLHVKYGDLEHYGETAEKLLAFIDDKKVWQTDNDDNIESDEYKVTHWYPIPKKLPNY